MTAETPLLLLRVAAAWPLPGLGLLALPDGPTPRLLPYALHTALAVSAVRPDGTRQPATATVEEVNRPEAHGPVRGLLLDLDSGSALPAATEIWLAANGPDGPQ